jgi:hypothetical protein
MKIYFIIAFLTFPYNISLKYYFFTKYKFYTYSYFFHKIPTQSLIKNKKIKDEREKRNIYIREFARDSPHNVLLAFSQSYVKHDLRKNKIVVAPTTFFCEQINFYELIFMF